jgi:hypothetical protein
MIDDWLAVVLIAFGSGGDFARAAAAKGDDVDANAAKPVRLVAVGAMIDDWLAVALIAFGSGNATVDANGELVDAYAKNPL